MCDPSKIFGGADTSAATAATAKAQEEARQALQAQVQAQNDAAAAADSNSETTRLASEAAMRRLASGAMFGAGGEAVAGNNSAVFTRQLFGS